MDGTTSTKLTRRVVLATGVASTAALAGCSGLSLGGGNFEFPDGDPNDSQKEIVRVFVTRVHNEEYDAASERFTNEMDNELPPDRIESVWSENVGSLEEYVEISTWGIEPDGDGEAVFARVECANGYYALQLSLIRGQIYGVFIRNVVKE